MHVMLSATKQWITKAFRGATVATRTLVTAALTAALFLTIASPVRAAESDDTDPVASFLAARKPVICYGQTYGLCAGSPCFVFNDVAYCSCKVKKGKSISAPFDYPGGNVCSLNAAGVDNGFMVSTFSLPPALAAGPSGSQALYACPRTSKAKYAKCDGGICFKSTQRKMPGELGDEIACSCPVETTNPRDGLEIIGPYPCQQSFFKNCEAAIANNATGTTLYDGTSIGATVAATGRLYGSVPKLNSCPKQF